MSLFYEPNKAKLERLIEDSTLSSGATILVPDLQRAYVWNPEQVILLVDSLIKGWPFGSLLLWAVEPKSLPDSSIPPMPKRSFWSMVSRIGTDKSSGLPEAIEPTPYRMVLDGQQRLQSLVIAFKGMAYGFELYDHDWIRSLELPPRKETRHWSRACLCVNLSALNNELSRNQKIIEWVDFRKILKWVVWNLEDESTGRTGQQQTPLTKRCKEKKEPLIPLSKFWEKSMVTHVRQPGKYDTALTELFFQFSISEEDGYRKNAESLLDKLAELKATDVHYLEILPFTSAFDLDQYNDAVVNIFARLNSAGRALEPEEITFAWIKMNWLQSPDNSYRSAYLCYAELSDQLSANASIRLHINDLVRGMSAVWATLFSNGTLLKEKDLLKADKLKPMSNELAGCWNDAAAAVLTMSTRIASLGLKYRDTYFSLNALFVLWGLESIVNTWRARAHLKVMPGDSFDKDYELLLEGTLDRWFLLSQWAGAWAQSSETEFQNHLKSLTDLKANLASTTNGQQAITLISNLINLWIDNFKPNARQFIANLNASSRASVRQYYGPLWIWNRLDQKRWNIAKLHLREFHRRQSKLLETDVDHIIAINLWKTKTFGQVSAEEEALTLNSIGNCCLLEKTFNISKSDEPAYNFFGKINEFRLGNVTFVDLVRSFRLQGSLLRPNGRDKQRLSKLINMRERRIKADLSAYVNGQLSRSDI